MYELQLRLQVVPVRQFFLDKVLDGFDVVVGSAFDLLYALSVCQIEIVDQLVEKLRLLFRPIRRSPKKATGPTGPAAASVKRCYFCRQAPFGSW